MARRATAAAAGAVGAGIVLGLTACAGGASGPVVERQVEIEDVRAVDLASSGDLTVRRGDTPSLTIRASEGTQERLVSEVRDGVLVLDSRSTFGFSRLGDIEYELVIGELEQLVISGSGDVAGSDVTGGQVRVLIEGSGSIELEGVDADELQAAIEGSGDIELTGDAASVDLGIEGSGEIDAEDLRADEADTSIEGSGDISVHAERRLAVAISGSGTVRYTGDPEVSSDVDGSGDVVQG
ncbi:head GIN domain-containing protein [Cellulomonas endometrii]|uniref:head GIN domain-containing protein n=1 Tax=Cellulomonas endometrii TaxID=3036301 RepID=UPI0024AE5A06|nr:head GIN domain-containing protein [Cellulomonas endometrii]